MVPADVTAVELGSDHPNITGVLALQEQDQLLGIWGRLRNLQGHWQALLIGREETSCSHIFSNSVKRSTSPMFLDRAIE